LKIKNTSIEEPSKEASPLKYTISIPKILSTYHIPNPGTDKTQSIYNFVPRSAISKKLTIKSAAFCLTSTKIRQPRKKKRQNKTVLLTNLDTALYLKILSHIKGDLKDLKNPNRPSLWYQLLMLMETKIKISHFKKKGQVCLNTTTPIMRTKAKVHIDCSNKAKIKNQSKEGLQGKSTETSVQEVSKIQPTANSTNISGS
jgi:hypothetical protein